MHGTADAGTYTVADLSQIMGKSERWMQVLANDEQWPHTEEPWNGSTRWRFHLLDLPPELQERIRRWQTGTDDASVDAMVAAHSIQATPEQLRDPKVATLIRMTCECLAVPQCRGRDGRIRDIASSYGYDRATAYRAMGRVKKGLPIKSSARQWGHTFSGLDITVRAWEPEAARLAIEAIVGNRHERSEKLHLYNRVCAEAGRLHLQVGTYESFCRLARRVNPALLKYRDAGHRGLREDIIPSIRRDFTAYRAMECLIGDQHKADYYCLDAAGQVVTLELFCWLDFRTQLAWGAIAYKHYNRYTVGQSLLHAVRHGLPGMVYTDWGKPEESDYMTQLIEQLGGLGVKAESIRHVNATVRNPQAKPIEGWFGHLDAKLRNDLVPGYSKRLPDGRENELHQKQVKDQIRAGELWPMQQITEWLMGRIDAWNHHQFKNRGPDTGKTPWEVYAEETARHPVTTLAPEVLEYLFLPVQPTTVRRSQVRVKHPWLRSLLYYAPELSAHGGEAVEVRFDPFDQKRVYVFEDRGARSEGRGKRSGGGKLICVAEEWGMINPKMTTAVAEKIEAQRGLEKQVRELHEEWRPRGRRQETVDSSQEKNKIRKIHPLERQAREVVRVMRTQLDEIDAETGEVVEAEAGGGRGYRPLVFARREEPGQRLQPFRLSISGDVDETETCD